MPFIQFTYPVNNVQNEKYMFDRALECHIPEASLDHISNCWWVPFNEKRLLGFLSNFIYLEKTFINKFYFKNFDFQFVVLNITHHYLYYFRI